MNFGHNTKKIINLHVGMSNYDDEKGQTTCYMKKGLIK